MNANINQNQQDALARLKQVVADAKKANEEYAKKSAELAAQVKSDIADLENLESNLKKVEVDAINKMDVAVMEFLASGEEEEK